MYINQTAVIKLIKISGSFAVRCYLNSFEDRHDFKGLLTHAVVYVNRSHDMCNGSERLPYYILALLQSKLPCISLTQVTRLRHMLICTLTLVSLSWFWYQRVSNQVFVWVWYGRKTLYSSHEKICEDSFLVSVVWLLRHDFNKSTKKTVKIEFI